jgi:hypothetical protein
MIATELGHIEEVVVQGIFLCEVRAVADLSTIVVIK